MMPIITAEKSAKYRHASGERFAGTGKRAMATPTTKGIPVLTRRLRCGARGSTLSIVCGVCPITAPP
jgi:hypothetical protein